MGELGTKVCQRILHLIPKEWTGKINRLKAILKFVGVYYIFLCRRPHHHHQRRPSQPHHPCRNYSTCPSTKHSTLGCQVSGWQRVGIYVRGVSNFFLRVRVSGRNEWYVDQRWQQIQVTCSSISASPRRTPQVPTTYNVGSKKKYRLLLCKSSVTR